MLMGRVTSLWLRLRTLNSSAGAVDTLSITADDVDLSGSINAGTGDVSLLPSNSTTVGLGAGAGDFSLTDTELDNITTSGTLTIGNSNTTAMTINGWTAAAGVSGPVVLVATGYGRNHHFCHSCINVASGF